MSHKKAKSERRNIHHIYPRSRVPSRSKDKSNLKEVPISYHEAYHHLFINMTPEEVLEYLREVWFSPEEFISPEKWIPKFGRT